MSFSSDPASVVTVKGQSLDDYAGLRMLLSDMRLAGMLVNEARYSSLDRLFGISREDSNLVTLVALGMLGAAGHRTWSKVAKGPPSPTFGDSLLFTGGVQGAFGGVAGAQVRDRPDLVALLAFAVVASSVGPVLSRSWRTAHGAVHRARMGFDHRYGHIFRPSRRRPPRT